MHEGQAVPPRAGEPALPAFRHDTAALDVNVQNMVLTPAAARNLPGELSCLVAELGLTQLLPDLEALKSELQKLVLGLHPDKTGGAFKCDHDKARFMRARRAVDLLNAEPGADDGDDGAAAGPLPGTPRAIGDARPLRIRPEIARRLQARTMAYARDRISRYFAVPKIGSATVAAVLLLLVGLSHELAGHPLLGPLLADPDAATFLVATAGLGAMGTLALWLCERRAEARAAHLMSEAALGDIFEQARRCADRHGRAGRLSEFDIRQGIEMLIDGRRDERRSPRGRLFARVLDLTTVEGISALQTQRLLERRVIRPSTTPSIEMLYEVSPRAMQG
jgi:hypothetical protein